MLRADFYKNSDFLLFEAKKQHIQETNTTVPSLMEIKLSSIGNNLSASDWLWISLVQYIGEHILDDQNAEKNEKFVLENLKTITNLSPNFTRAYEWTLLILPIPNNENLIYTNSQKQMLAASLEIAKQGIYKTCNHEKIAKIIDFPIQDIRAMLGRDDLKNPCQSGMLPYLIAFYGGQLGQDSTIAENYYKIASMQDDAPSISQILAVIGTGDKDNPKIIATKLALIAINGYDEKPFECSALANTIVNTLQKNDFSKNTLYSIQKSEKLLTPPKNPNIIGAESCYNMLERSIKYTFLSFFDEMGAQLPDMTTQD